MNDTWHIFSWERPRNDAFTAPVHHLRARRKALINGLDRRLLTFNTPAGGMFVLVDVSKTGLTGESFARSLLEHEDVAVVPGFGFGESMDSIPANAVAGYLGCDDNTAAAILADGHATRIFAEIPRSESRCANAIQRVTIASLDVFMARMLERATPIDDLSLYVEPIGKAAKHLHWQADRIIRLVRAGKVPLVRLRNRREFGALCVDRQDFRWILSAPPLPPCLTRDQAAAQLGVDLHTVDLLMRAARQDGSPLIRRVQPMSGKGRNR
nr:aminotransferase class I/II-fold pyridoxal phosphate-dependent enzyme [Pseudogemmobacter hezensis]